MAQKGQFNWVFADGDRLPVGKDSGDTITVTNLNEAPARLTFDVYFSDRDPVKGLTYTLGAERVNCFRLDEPFCDQKYNIPLGSYSIVLHSDVPVVAVFGRVKVCTHQGYFY